MNAERLLALYERVAEAPDAIARLRRFILDLALRGKLVPQDPQDEPAPGLFKKILKEKEKFLRPRRESQNEPSPVAKDEEPFRIPDNWNWTRLGSIADLVRGISFSASDKAAMAGPKLVPCFRSGNIQSELVWGDFIYVPRRILKSDQQLVREGDILISIANSYELVGKCSIVRSVRDEATFGAFLAAIRLYALSREYIRYFLSSDYSARQFRLGSAQTTNIANITFATIRNHAVPLPPLAEQHRIVAKVDELMALCDRLEAARKDRETKRDRLSAASLARLNTPDPETFTADARFTLEALPALTTRPNQIKQLRQTILNLAIRGKLVPQDPNDEPASELLGKLRKAPSPNPPMRASPGCASSASNSARACISGPLTGGKFRPANPPSPRSIPRSGATPTPAPTAPAISMMPSPSARGFPRRTRTAASQASCNQTWHRRKRSSRRWKAGFWALAVLPPNGVTWPRPRLRATPEALGIA